MTDTSEIMPSQAQQAPDNADSLLPAELRDQPNAPWNRPGAAPLSTQRAVKWRHDVKNHQTEDREQKKRRRDERRRQRREAAEAENRKKLEDNARLMYFIGFFALPLVWLVMLMYYHDEHLNPQGNQNIKRYYRNARVLFVIYTALFVGWFVTFQVFRDRFTFLNILYYEGVSPSNY